MFFNVVYGCDGFVCSLEFLQIFNSDLLKNLTVRSLINRTSKDYELAVVFFLKQDHEVGWGGGGRGGGREWENMTWDIPNFTAS